MADSKENLSVQVGILREIKTPLGVFGLALLVIEAILALLAARLEEPAVGLVAGGLVLVLLLVVAIFSYLILKKPEVFVQAGGRDGDVTLPKLRPRYDVFLSSPMAAFTQAEEYTQDRNKVMKVIEVLRRECRFDSVFYAGRDIQSMADFDPVNLSIDQDFQALVESRYFVMLYPRSIVSSVLVEAGWALALGKPCIFFVAKRGDLPFLLRQAESLFSVQVYEAVESDAICSLITKHREKLFAMKAEARQ